MKRPGGLGRGLSALLEDGKEREPTAGGVEKLPIDRVAPNPDQPRRHFDEEALAELAQSIAERGVIQPILVRPHGDEYQIIAGERRWRAAQQAQLHEIPAIVRTAEDDVTAELALIENIQREDLNALEEANAYRALSENYQHSQGDIARIVGKSRSHVANLVRLLDLPTEVQQMLLGGKVSMGHARALIGHADAVAIAQRVEREGLSVRQVEALVKGDAPSDKPKPARVSQAAGNPDIEALERQLSDLLGLDVKVRHHDGGGQVSVKYRTLDQLDMVCQRLSGEQI